VNGYVFGPPCPTINRKNMCVIAFNMEKHMAFCTTGLIGNISNRDDR